MEHKRISLFKKNLHEHEENAKITLCYVGTYFVTSPILVNLYWGLCADPCPQIQFLFHSLASGYAAAII